VPKDLERNLAYRRHLARCPREWRRSWKLIAGYRSADAYLWWLNAVAWTFDPRKIKTGESPHLPFITWEFQDNAARQLWDAVNTGYDRLIDKSRDMGASWLCLTVLLWFWQFHGDMTFLVASRKEEYVDSAGNPDCLFWKLDYLIENQPTWMRPKFSRRHMHLKNLDNKSVLDGESTNQDIGKGGRRNAILLDEFAAVEKGTAILAATADATPCRIFNSTPMGMGNAFANVRFSGKVPITTLHWSQHPEKGAGKRLVTIDGEEKWTSPWYEAECARRTSRQEIAQELDIEYRASGQAFYDLQLLQRYRASDQLYDPIFTGELTYEVGKVEGKYGLRDVQWVPGGRRRLSVWCPLDPDLNMLVRPSQEQNYVAFADISQGTGASNSVLAVVSTTTREQCALLVSPDLPPHEFAQYCVSVCKWFGGGVPVLLGWEANNSGGFSHEVSRLGYGWCLGNPNPDIPWYPKDSKVGWWSTTNTRETVLSDLEGFLKRQELFIHDEATIVEMESYQWGSSGKPEPASFAEEGSGAKATHGDRVIATAGIVLCLREQGKVKRKQSTPPDKSWAARRRAFERKQQLAKRW